MDEPVVRAATVKVAGSSTPGGQGAALSVADDHRLIPAEVPVALVYDGSSYAVMMASPKDIEDFAVGFSFTEGAISKLDDIREIEIVTHDHGIEARIWLTTGTGRALVERRRQIAGPTGCGLCGIESLDEAVADVPKVTNRLTTTPAEIQRALTMMAPGQEMNRQTRATHAAAFWNSVDGSVTCVREDVGRHNALDKLAGHLMRNDDTAADGLLLLTSRVSLEMVQKAARIGAEIIVAISAPTELALRTAEAAGITLVAVARSDGFEIFTHRERIKLTPNDKIAGSGGYLHAVG